MPQPTLGIDIGSGTISAAVVGEDGTPEVLTVQDNGQFPASVIVTPEGEVTRPDRPVEGGAPIGGLTRFLGRPPQVLGAGPVGVHTLFTHALAPVLDAAENQHGSVPKQVAAVVPDHWPEFHRHTYVRALTAATGANVIAVSEPEAWAGIAQHDSGSYPVTICLDLGATRATCTIVTRDRRGRTNSAFHIADPLGGQGPTDRVLVSEIVAKIRPDFDTDQWERYPTSVGTAARKTALRATHRSDQVTVHLPAPVGDVNVLAVQVCDLVEDLVGEVVDKLIRRPEVTELLSPADGNTGLMVAGGFSADRSAATAVRSKLGGFKAFQHPESVLAVGGAVTVAGVK